MLILYSFDSSLEKSLAQFAEEVRQIRLPSSDITERRCLPEPASANRSVPPGECKNCVCVTPLALASGDHCIPFARKNPVEAPADHRIIGNDQHHHYPSCRQNTRLYSVRGAAVASSGFGIPRGFAMFVCPVSVQGPTFLRHGSVRCTNDFVRTDRFGDVVINS